MTLLCGLAYVDRLTLDEDLIKSSILMAEEFWKLCVLPELLGKWFPHQKLPRFDVETDKDSGKWCLCKENRGGGMIGCDGKSCQMKWFHLTCLGMSESVYQKESGFVPHAKISSGSQYRGNLHATTSINFIIISVL